MEKKNWLNYLSEIVLVVFIPFFIVLFIEFVLKIGMGPFVERISFFFATFAAILGLSSYVWIKKGIIFGLVPILLSPLVLMFFFTGQSFLRIRFFYFLISAFTLTFISILIYAISKVVKKRTSSRVLSILLFFLSVIVFVFSLSMIEIIFGHFNSHITITQSLVSGVRGGILLGSGVTIVLLLLAQRIK